MARSEDRGGRVLGGCVLHEQVGSGASGAVYRAVQQSLGREVAVKVLRGRDRQALERFRREAEVTSRLNSRNIAQVIDFGTSPEGESYFIMELLHGEDLASRLERVGRLELEAALRLAEEIARALRLAHDNHVVHRDLKPQNIFLHQTPDDGEVVKVIDFGVSRILARRGNGPGAGVASGALDDGELVGSPLYMAPEQIDGREGAVDERSDVYALGAVVYEMLTGRSPYAGARGLLELLAEIMGPRPPPDPAALAPGLPRAVARAILHALEKRPEERPASVTAFFNELRHAARGREAAAPRPTAALVGTQRVGTTFVSGTLVAPLWRKRRIPDELRFAVPEGGFEDGVPGARSLELAPGRGEWFVGRHPACELVLPHSRVSRRAVRVTLRAGRAQLCRLRECTVPVRVGLASLAPGDERPLHHGEPVAIGAVSGVFLDGRYVPPQISPQDLDVETGLLGRDGLAWELGLALRMDERARLFVVAAAHADGGDAELAVRAALALHVAVPERPVARIDGVAAVLLGADEAPGALLEAVLRALAPPASDRPAAPSPAARAAPDELVAGTRLVTGTSDEAGARLDETCRALERLAASGAGAGIEAARGVVDLALYAGSTTLGPEELGAVARSSAEAGGTVTLFALEDAPRLARLGRGIFEALELELAELVARAAGPAARLGRPAPGALACVTTGPFAPREIALAWRDRGSVRVEALEADRSVRFARVDGARLADLARAAALLGAEALDDPWTAAAVVETLPQPLARAARALAEAPAAEAARRWLELGHATTGLVGATLAASLLAGGASPRGALPQDDTPWARALAELARASSDPPPRVATIAHACVPGGVLALPLDGASRGAHGDEAAAPPSAEARATWLGALSALRSWALIAVERSDRLDWERDAHRVRYLDFTGSEEPCPRVASLPAPLLAEAGLYLTRLSERLVVPLDPWLAEETCAACARPRLWLTTSFRAEPGTWTYRCTSCGAERALAVAAERLPEPLARRGRERRQTGGPR